MRGKYQSARGNFGDGLEFGLGEIDCEIQNSAVFIEIDNVESRNLRSARNAAERIQPEAIFHVAKAADDRKKRLVYGIDKIDLCTKRALTGPVAGAQLRGAHIPLFQGSCLPQSN